MHDVYAYGVIAASTVVELESAYPEEAGYAEIRRVHRAFGGEAAGGAHVLARLGIPTKLVGSLLGTDGAADRAVELLSDAGVDCSGIAQVEGSGVTELIVSSGAERTIFATYGEMLAEREWVKPERSDVSASKVVCLDSFFGDDSEQVAEWCLQDGIPYVTVDAPPEAMVTEHATAIVVSGEYASSNFEAEPEDVLREYASRCGGLAILTQGAGPALFRRGSGRTREMPAFDVPVVDTMGAGDSFRAGVALGILRGLDDAETVRTASAIAAMVCQTVPGVLGSPTPADLAAFLSSRGG
jgi:sugar/nucleoside kinase (ribokinase family)